MMILIQDMGYDRGQRAEGMGVQITVVGKRQLFFL